MISFGGVSQLNRGKFSKFKDQLLLFPLVSGSECLSILKVGVLIVEPAVTSPRTSYHVLWSVFAVSFWGLSIVGLQYWLVSRLQIQLNLYAALGLGALFLIVALLPVVFVLFVHSHQRKQNLDLLPQLDSLSEQDVESYCGRDAPLLLALQSLLRQHLKTINELNSRNELFADALDELNDIGLQLRRSERRRALALSATGDGIWEWRADTDAWYFSARWKTMLGYLEHELENESATFACFIHSDDVTRVQNQFAQFILPRKVDELQLFEAEFRMQHRAGEWITVLSRAVADRDAEGRIVSVVGAQADVSEQRRAMAELSSAKEAAEKAVMQLKGAQLQMIESEKLAALGALVAGVAHEVNTPLGIALTAASTLHSETQALSELINDGGLKKTQLQDYLLMAQEATQLILRHCQNAAGLIRSFKNISVDQTAEMVREFDLGMYLGEILRSLKPNLKPTQHQIELDCPTGLMVHTHPSAFTQILNNLVNNSIMHAFVKDQRGLMTIQVTTLSDELIEVRFMDNGIGIPPTLRAKVFEPFYTTKRGQGGSGLGMSIVHNLVVAQLKGRISIEDTPGGGTCFVIVFPRVL